VTDHRDFAMLAPSNLVLSQHIAKQLREAIVFDRLKPGQRILEREIAEVMQTSRGPVRDALRLLENEGLVERRAHRGSFVIEFSLDDAEEIYSLREAIESVAVKYLIMRATAADLDELNSFVQNMAARIEAGIDLDEAAELDLAFHRALCRISGHRRALAAWEALSSQTRVLLLSRFKRQPHDFRELAVEWHRRLVDALCNRNLAAAQDELSKHLAATMNSLLRSAGTEERPK
jgi:DNA-binding GntR family transcriptional regulator